jgi:DNA replication and repair protein RecF
VENIVNIVAGDDYGQIFITDTNREHLDRILSTANTDYRLYHVKDGKFVVHNA